MDGIDELLPQLLRFRPWPQGDPVAPWVLKYLDENQLINLARAGVELNQAVLEAQMKANSRALQIIQGMERK